MYLFKDTQKSISDLIEESRQYVGLQKRCMQKELSNRLTTLLSAIAIAAVLILLGSIVLLLLCFTLAYFIGQVLESTALGFVCMTGAALLTLLVVYFNRGRWISRPLARLVSSTLESEDDKEHTNVEELHEQIKTSQKNMQTHLSYLTEPAKRPATRAEQVSGWINRGLALYEGLRIGLSAATVIAGLLGTRKRRRR